MLAIQISRTGGPEVLDAVDISIPDPGPGQVRLRHEAVGVNFIDTYHRTGLYPLKLPITLGQEAAGVVDAVGEGVTSFKPGDRAAYTGVFGGYAEYNLVPAARLLPLPESVSAEAAAGSLLKGMTAEFLLHRCRPVRSGETILVHAAAGGVGAILCQWAKFLGVHVIGTVGSEEKAALAKQHGCQDVILYRHEDIAERVKAITAGAGVPVVYDGVGAATFEASLSSLSRRGMLVSFGNASGPAPAIEPGRLSRMGSLYLTRPTLFDYIAKPEELAESSEALFHVIATGAVKIEIGQRFALKDARKAHEALEARDTVGSSILIP